MESSGDQDAHEQESLDTLPPLIKSIAAKEVAGFDSIEEQQKVNNQRQQADFHPFSFFSPIHQETQAPDVHSQTDQFQPHGVHSVSISMPSSPLAARLQTNKTVTFIDHVRSVPPTDVSTSFGVSPAQAKFYSQPMPRGLAFDKAAVAAGKFPGRAVKSLKINKLRDNRYDSFKTWSGKLERQLSYLHGKPREAEAEEEVGRNPSVETLPVERYFDALEGPELDTLRASEEIILPEDKQWPFLLRFPISSFGMCLGVTSQAIMWKTLATSSSTEFLHISFLVNLIFWYISVVLVTIIFIVYILKVIFYFEAVRREYYHPIRINFFFAPFIALLFLALGVPPSVTKNLHTSLWYVLMTPILILELKLYGQWMSGGQRRLSKVANPSNHLSIVGNFVGALLGASMGLREGPVFFFAVGLAHYTVLFVTLYQRLPTNETLPKELHPVFFLFVAAPSVASMAWAKIQGRFDYGSRIAYFIAMFLYFSLAVRVNFFRGFRFSLAWWAYTFPMTGAAIATIKYCNEVPNVVTKSLVVILCAISTLIVTSLLATTIVHAFVLRDLFPNDMAIAISDERPTPMKWFHTRNGSSDRDIENYLKFADMGSNDIEANVAPTAANAITVDDVGREVVQTSHF